MAATLVALALARVYELWLLPVTVGLGTAELFRPLVLWGNDGLMVVFRQPGAVGPQMLAIGLGNTVISPLASDRVPGAVEMSVQSGVVC